MNNKFLNKKNIIKYLIILSSLILIFISSYHFSHIAYFYSDHRWFEFLHNISLEKGIFENYVNSSNLNGINFQIINPKLNPLSTFNFNLTSDLSYIFYISFLRIAEIIVVCLYVNYFCKKKFIKIFPWILFFYFILIYNFQIFDHNSYISFPIIFFNFTLALSLYFQNKNYIFFFIIFIGNLISFLVNPIYFLIPVFLPLIFFYLYFLDSKNYSKILILFLTNLPFAIYFSSIALGTARIGVYNELRALDLWYNFEIFKSPIFLLISLLILTLSVKKIITDRISCFLVKIYIYIFFATFMLGLIWKFQLIKWQLPQPEYFDYSLQYIYLLIFIKIFITSKKDIFKKISFLLLLVIFFYKSFNVISSFYNHSYIISKSTPKFYNTAETIQKRFFWEKDEDLFFKNDLKKKSILLDLPNNNSELFKASWNDNDAWNEHQKLVLLTYQYNIKFGHNLWHMFFHKDLVRTNLGHTAYMDVSTFKSNSELGKIYPKESVPPISVDSKLNYILKADYILSDKLYKYKIIKTYDFKDYNIYLYEINISFNKEIKKIIQIENYKDFHQNIKNFKNNLYVNKDLNSIKNIRNFCEIETIVKSNTELNFKINNKNNKDCVAVFSIPFSYQNDFINLRNLETCKTFRVQYYFHGCVFKNSEIITLKKKNLLQYPYFSIKDFIENKKLKII